jgi:hypothetical protein
MLKSFDSNNNTFLPTLIGFNIGVEIAQIFIILCIVSILFIIKKYTNYAKFFIISISLSIATIGLYWVFDRINF